MAGYGKKKGRQIDQPVPWLSYMGKIVSYLNDLI